MAKKRLYNSCNYMFAKNLLITRMIDDLTDRKQPRVFIIVSYAMCIKSFFCKGIQFTLCFRFRFQTISLSSERFMQTNALDYLKAVVVGVLWVN